MPIRVRRFNACPCRPDRPLTVPALCTRHAPIAPELRYLPAKFAALMPFGRVAGFLADVFPLAARPSASTIRDRTLRVGKRLMRTAHARTGPPRSCDHVVVGLDGAYVRNRHRRPARTFEVVAGQIRNGDGTPPQFAFVRAGRVAGVEALTQALCEHGVTPNASTTVLTDGVRVSAPSNGRPCRRPSRCWIGFTSPGAGSTSTNSRRAPRDT